MSTHETTQMISARMDAQRAQLHQQFVKPPTPTTTSSEADRALPTASAAMQPYQPKSMLMKLLVANPKLVEHLVVLVATTLLSARYTSWTKWLISFFWPRAARVRA